MRLLVGLGNPGARYRGTRHNVGFEALDRLLQAGGGSWTEATETAVRAEILLQGEPVTLMKPLTYMNLSGGPIREWLERRALGTKDVLVYFDDMALPLGTLRLRPGGSDGGHRGLASVLQALSTEDVPRLRIGIRPPSVDVGAEELAGFVLSRFTPEERRTVDEVLDRVVAATKTVLEEGLTTAMSRFNRAPS